MREETTWAGTPSRIVPRSPQSPVAARRREDDNGRRFGIAAPSTLVALGLLFLRPTLTPLLGLVPSLVNLVPLSSSRW
jgi:hypothetical protein